MSYMLVYDSDGWFIHPTNMPHLEQSLAAYLSKLDGMKICHFMNGGSAVPWKEIEAIMRDTDNYEEPK